MWGDLVDISALRDKLGEALRFGRSDSDGDYRLPDDRMDRSNYGSEDSCAISKVMRNKCNTEEVEPGKFVRKCEKTQEIFRNCVGRPTELIESKTEYTEEDVSRDSSMVSNPRVPKFDELEPYVPPIFRGDLENFHQGLFGGLDTFINAAEEMAHDFFKSFRYPEEGDSHSPFERGVGSIPKERKHREDKIHKEETGYGDMADKFEEI